jgi:hypothetical protein
MTLLEKLALPLVLIIGGTALYYVATFLLIVLTPYEDIGAPQINVFGW